MGIKSIVSLIAFVVSFALSSSLALVLRGKPARTEKPFVTSCGHRSVKRDFDSALGRKMSRFIQQDIDNGLTRRNSVSVTDSFDTESETSLAAYAGAVETYVDASSSMDDSTLPRDFQTAWRAHMQAWREYSDFSQQSQTTKQESQRGG